MPYYGYGDLYEDDYVPVLRHASSAGGTRDNVEDWTILSWYGTIHNLSIAERTTVGVGMSQSQKVMWHLVSKVAYKRAVFPETLFDADHMITPDVGNFDLWFLLHEFTRKTYVAELCAHIGVDWFLVYENEKSRVWDMYFVYPDGAAKLEYSHWRGNTAQQAQTRLEKRGLPLNLFLTKDFYSKTWITTTAAVKSAQTGNALPALYNLHEIGKAVNQPPKLPCEDPTPCWSGPSGVHSPVSDTVKRSTGGRSFSIYDPPTKDAGAREKAYDILANVPAEESIATTLGRLPQDLQSELYGFLGFDLGSVLAVKCPTGSAFDDVAKSLKEEAKALDIREESLVKREIEVAEREKKVLADEAPKAACSRAGFLSNKEKDELELQQHCDQIRPRWKQEIHDRAQLSKSSKVLEEEAPKPARSKAGYLSNNQADQGLVRYPDDALEVGAGDSHSGDPQYPRHFGSLGWFI